MLDSDYEELLRSLPQFRIDRVAARYDVWMGGDFPFAKIQVKVLQRAAGDFAAHSNCHIRNIDTKYPDAIAGLGDSVAEAVKDLLAHFGDIVRQNTPPGGLTEECFEWSDPSEF